MPFQQELQARSPWRAPLPPAAPPVPPVPRRNETASEDAPVIQQYLPPVDGGLAAWKLLGAAFVFEAFLWGLNTSFDSTPTIHALTNQQQAGFPLSFGVFQDYYSRLPQFADDPFIPVIGTVASGISYLGAPLIIPVVRRYPNYQRQMIWVGCTFLHPPPPTCV